MTKLWGGRFKKKTDGQFERFSASFQWDKRLLPYDLQIDAAHVKALKKCGVLSSGESVRLLSALDRLEDAALKGLLKLDPLSEDVHSAVHFELKKLVGPLADKLHTGRSRNDLVSQSSRLYCKEYAGVLSRLLRIAQRSLVAKADEFKDALLPGMTHMQNAQVLSQAHVFLSYVEMFERDRQALALAANFADVCVLGSGALAGTTFALDQELIAGELGLSRVTDNSYDVSGDRDFALQLLWAVSTVGLHLSRIAEDLMLGQTKGFGFIDVDQSFCTGSSMMPQKKNADFLELLRGASGVFAANATGLFTVLKGLPTSYNRDLQWDKKFLFDTVENCAELLEMFSRLVDGLGIRAHKAEEALADESLYATDLADYLASKGVPFKEAHDQVGQIVSFAEENCVAISKIGLDILKRFAPEADGGVYELFDAEHSVSMKKTKGSTHPREIRRQITRWNQKLRNS
jgi:argininosuccinate lyase